MVAPCKRRIEFLQMGVSVQYKLIYFRLWVADFRKVSMARIVEFFFNILDLCALFTLVIHIFGDPIFAFQTQ